MLGQRPGRSVAAFMFDNERFAHKVEVKPFSIAKAPITNSVFAEFGEADDDGNLPSNKRRYPWSDSYPADDQNNLDGRALGCVDVAAHASGDSAFGCRQMLGNAWE